MLSASKKYLFDTLGFVVIRNVLSPSEIDSMNAAISNHSSDFHERTGCLRNSSLGASGRRDCGNFLTWSDGDVFRSLLCHPHLHGILNELCGVGHRLDHKPILFVQSSGGEGFDLHGGAVTGDGKFNFPISYHCHSGEIVCNLINVAVQLTDTPNGAGGFVVIPGSHKSNFPPPISELQHLADTFGYQPECKAGDVILFTEALLHGAAVRTAETERRVALIRFAPATCAYARGYLGGDGWMELLTPAQRAVVQPPFNLDLERVCPQHGGGDAVHIPRVRKEEKKLFDQVVFNEQYY